MKKVICLLLAAFFQYMLYAQDKTADSLLKIIREAKIDTAKVRLLYDLSDFYSYYRDLDSALVYNDRGLELSKKTGRKDYELTGLINSSFLQALNGKTDLAKQATYAGLSMCKSLGLQNSEFQLKLYRRLGRIYSESNPDSSIYYHTRVIKLAQALHLPLDEARGSGELGYQLIFLGKYPQALMITMRGVQIAEEYKDTPIEAANYRFLGNIYFFAGEVRQSIHYYDTAEFLVGKLRNINSDSLKDDIETMFDAIYVAKARAYLKLRILDSALLYANQSYKISRKTYTSSVTSRIINILGKIYKEMGSDSIALNYFHLGISFSLSHNSNTAAIQTYNSLSEYFYEKQSIDSSMFYAKKAVELIQRTGVLLDEPETYGILANLYKAKRNFDSTVKYMQLMQTAKDSLLGKDKIEQMQFIVFDEVRQKKEQQAIVLAYQNKMKFYSLLVGVALLFIVAGFLWRSTRVKQKSYIQLQKQQEETDFQRKTAEGTLKKLQVTQSQLIQSEKMASLGELTAGIAHEIQNPLNFVNNFSEVNRELTDELEEEIDKGNYQQAKAIARNIKENEEKINHHGRRAETIVKGMLQHAQSGTGRKEQTDINALADEYLRLSYQGLRARDKSFSAGVKTDFDESVGKMNIVPQEIGRVLLNLFNNAFYAVVEKKKKQVEGLPEDLAKPGSLLKEGYEPTVFVSTKKIDGKVEIKVKDNGMGIPQKALDKIFQPFFTTKPAGQGTGLGLSLSYDIIKAQEGEIRVETKEGEYAEFIIHLPIKTN